MLTQVPRDAALQNCANFEQPGAIVHRRTRARSAEILL